MAEIETINGNPIVADIASESITPVVDAWLTAHPEATTTVADGAITTVKLADGSVTDVKLAQTGGVLEKVGEIAERVRSTNLYDESAAIDGYFVSQTNGTIGRGADYSYWEYIDVAYLDTVYISSANRMDTLGLRYALYDEDKAFISGAVNPTISREPYLQRNFAAIDTSNAAYLRLSYATSTISASNYFSVGASKSWQPYVDKTIPTGTAGMPIVESMAYGDGMPSAYLASMSAGSIIEVEPNNVQSDLVAAFYANVGLFGSIDIGQSNYGNGGTEYGTRIRIDGTSATWIIDGSTTGSIAHGLTIKDFILVTIKVSRDSSYVLTIRTNGGEWTRSNNYWNGVYGRYAVWANENTTLADCKLATAIDGLQAPIWLFGDSYAAYAATRWTYYLYQDGFRNVLINGASGEKSSQAMTSLRNLLEHGTPKFIIWAMGMNDADVEPYINTSWLSNVHEFIAICVEKGITPILATIPNTPNVYNSRKNLFVKNCGLRYIDFSTAVNANSQGATWYSGMLSTDNVHPTADGARALARNAASW